MTNKVRTFLAITIGLLAVILLTGLYFGIVSLAESPRHALNLFWKDRRLVIPILIGFGVQAGLFSAMRMRLHIPKSEPIPQRTSGGASAAGMGAGGTTSTVAMVACCAHHVTDVLPVLGLTAAATFLAKYQTAFMAVGLTTNVIGIAVILMVMIRQRNAATTQLRPSVMVTEE